MARSGALNRDALLAAALAAGATQDEAAEAARVSRRTLVRRLNDPAFRARLSDARGLLFREAADLAAGRSRLALETLRELLGPAQPPAVRLGAARALIETAARLREVVDLGARVEELERLAADAAKGGLR
ncbi:MAG: hypothetical protein ABFD84_10480 [Candidatus Polarisedimenticolia bacterium]